MAEKKTDAKQKKTTKYEKKKYCPKCGPGTSLAEHKDRRSCGKCGYLEKKND
ncbi:30S ribosomal protein S27ae [Candidatus Micrarchaeota archaeon]|nr:30S ribosomal protein S27ae [Candidatus Micrarchaeota archaeon]